MRSGGTDSRYSWLSVTGPFNYHGVMCTAYQFLYDSIPNAYYIRGTENTAVTSYHALDITNMVTDVGDNVIAFDRLQNVRYKKKEGISLLF